MLDENGNPVLDDAGNIRYETTNATKHFVKSDTGDSYNQFGESGNIDSNINWQQPTAEIVGKGLAGGINAVSHGKDWGTGARIGAAGGAAGYAMQTAMEMFGWGDTAQAAGYIIGNVAGGVSQTKQERANNNPIPAYSVPAFVGRNYVDEGRLSGLLKVKSKGTGDLYKRMDA